MRWLSIITSLDATEGGPPRAVLEILSALARSGEDTEVVAMHASNAALPPAVEAARQTGVKVTLVPVKRLGRLRMSLRFLLTAMKRGEHADVVTSHGFYQGNALGAWLAARRGSGSLQLQPHGAFEPFQEETSRRLKSLYRLAFGNRILRDVRLFVVASESEKRNLQASFPSIDSARIAVHGLGTNIPSGVTFNSPRFQERRVLYMSRIAAKKRLDKLIQAAAILAERGESIALTVCGAGDARLLAQLKDQARESGVAAVWAGHVSGERRREFERNHGLFCLPSDNENFGQAVTDAMAAGLAVITTTATAASEFVLSSRAGQVLSEPSALDLANAIAAEFSDAETLRNQAESGHNYALRNLSWEAVADRWRAAARNFNI